jgi:hypothetical protein
MKRPTVKVQKKTGFSLISETPDQQIAPGEPFFQKEKSSFCHSGGGYWVFGISPEDLNLNNPVSPQARSTRGRCDTKTPVSSLKGRRSAIRYFPQTVWGFRRFWDPLFHQKCCPNSPFDGLEFNAGALNYLPGFFWNNLLQ